MGTYRHSRHRSGLCVAGSAILTGHEYGVLLRVLLLANLVAVDTVQGLKAWGCSAQ